MQQLDALELPQQEVPPLLSELCMQVKVPRTTHASGVDTSLAVAVPELLRSRTRTRRRRRKRAWSVSCTYLLPVFLVYGAL